MKVGQIVWAALFVASSVPMVAWGQVLDRPRLLQERLDAGVPGEAQAPERAWSRTLLELGLEGYSPHQQAGYARECNYTSALETLRGIRRQLGVASTYQKEWARNQELVFSACDGRAAGATPPEQPHGKSLPSRAASDYLYQLASWHFYKREYELALPLFAKVRAAKGAPQRPNAAYMVVRTLAYLKRLDDAYAEIGLILSDASLRQVHGIAGNYRFVIMSNSNTFSAYTDTVLSPELATQHLRWLHGLLLADPDKALDPQQAAADTRDAREQLAIYFPLYDAQSKAVDWWLEGDAPSSARMQAVKALSPQLPLIDWMQASWAYNVFDTDWLWALHDESNPYWKQNSHIVSHAWRRWESERDGAWLQVAIQRVHPRDPLAEPILGAAHAFLARHRQARPVQEETPEYAAWIYSLWENAIRLHLAAGDMESALQLVGDAPQNLRTLGHREPTYFQRNTDPASTFDRTLRWLVYRGEVESARKMLAAVLKQYPQGFRKWRSLLATDLAEAHAAGQTQLPFSSVGVSDEPSAWQRTLDDASSEALYEIANGSAVQLRYRALMARTVLARALILGWGNEVVDRYAALAAKLNPSARELILAGVARHERADYVSLMLKLPRLRPTVMLEYAAAAEGESPYAKNEVALDAIDTYNHNDNNWWCAFNQQESMSRAFNAARILPGPARLFAAEQLKEEFESYLQKQRAVFAAHPYRSLVNPAEIAALEAVPSGPRFLSEAVIARENATAMPQELSPEERNARAADLHRAVRTTRYGCERDGSHAEYSKGAFSLLRTRYADTPWAKATPYWFK